MEVEIRSAFNKFIQEEEQTCLKAFFDSLNTEDGIMLQSYFEDFAKGFQSERIRELEGVVTEASSLIKTGLERSDTKLIQAGRSILTEALRKTEKALSLAEFADYCKARGETKAEKG